jgi:hypothetical protein
MMATMGMSMATTGMMKGLLNMAVFPLCRH